ncbi:COMM domain-containing protein 2 [Trichonephila clavata]|uniref:COMM domain-containing protein 2 n=1 Tax=Trichonephila clavata TaxID=2740835 RepID=A0A8X6FSX9_TRICU|nr:COMM domain-containing protein 2 [Trichonephila clavata]
MLLILDDIHKQHLDILKNVDEKIVREFCRISIEHLFKGSNPKVYQSAAQRLNVETDIVQNVITGIMQLLIEASKMMVNEIEFRDSIIVLGFNNQSQEELVKCYLDHNQEIRSLLSSLNMGIPHYKNLEWRLDVQIASRTLRRPMEPSMLLKLQLEEENKSENIILEADPSNIIHMTQVLDQALQEAKSQHFRRIMRTSSLLSSLL